MPALETHFHYRNLDVSTIKELARRWAPQVMSGFSKVAAHTALSDVRDSIEELRHYRRHMGTLRLCGRLRTGGTDAGASLARQRRTRTGAAWLCLLLAGMRGVSAFAQSRPRPRAGGQIAAGRVLPAKPDHAPGPPHNQVNAIAQTPDGYLWFGTWEGLVRHNGLPSSTSSTGATRPA